MAEAIKKDKEKKAAAAEPEAAKEKSYKFKAGAANLVIPKLGIRFVKGAYTTTDASIAKKLKELPGIEEA